jgi:arsenate reductase (glutaredoxin)
MKSVYFLSTCSTCQRILKQLNLPSDISLIDIKQTNISAEALDEIAGMAGSYERLFSKKAMKYKSLGYDKRTLSELEYRHIIVEEYTFLRRPVIVYDDFFSIGNSKEEVNKATAFFENLSPTK